MQALSRAYPYFRECVVFRCGLYAKIKIWYIVEQVSVISGKSHFVHNFKILTFWIQQKCTEFNIMLLSPLNPVTGGLYWLLQILINAFASDDSVLEQLHPLQ